MLYKLKLKRPDAENKVSSLFTRFAINGKEFKFYTGKTITVSNWSESKQMVLSGEPNYKGLNKYLKTWLNELDRIIIEMEGNKERLDRKVIQHRLNVVMNQDDYDEPLETGVSDFITFITDFIKTKADSPRNQQRLNQCKKHLIVANKLAYKQTLDAWNKLSNKQKSKTDLKADFPLRFEDVTPNLVKNFRQYFLTATYAEIVNKEVVHKNYKINYRDKQIQTLKQFIDEAFEAGLVKRFSFKKFKSEKIDVDSVYTNFKELQMMLDEPLTGTQELVRNKYVLNCFLGMRYSDFNRIEKHFFTKQKLSGVDCVVYTGRQVKTDNRVEFPLHPIAQKILEKYNFNIPKLSAKEYNEVLKVVAHRVGLRELVHIREVRGIETIERDIPKYELMSSHTARRSFCTNFYNEGVSISVIMMISGHKTEQEFRKYINKQSQVRLEVIAQQVTAIKGLTIEQKAA